ncbi:MAG: ABC transporter substrate-binding protein, partial [Deltaproteobacteria bacterium]
EGAEYTKAMFDAIKLAAKNFNDAGGINGKKIEIVSRDTKGDYGKTRDSVIELISDNVSAIIASPSGWSTFTPVSMANVSKTIFMVVGTQRHIGRSGLYVFRNSLPDETATEEAIRYCAEKLGYKRYVILTSMVDDEACLSVAGLYRRALQKVGGEVVADACTNLDLSIKETIKKVKDDAKGPIDAVIFAGSAGNAVDLAKELRSQGVQAPIVGSDVLYNTEFLKKGGSAVIGSLLYTSFTPLSDAPATVKFVKEYKAATGKEPSVLAALGYDSFMLIAGALKKTGTTNPVDVRYALTGIKDHPGVSGMISMSKDGESVKTPFLIKVEKGAKGPEFRLIK